MELSSEITLPPYVAPISGEVLKKDGDVLCSSAGEVFTIKNEIPRFVARESYANAFGLQWNHYSQVQLDSSTGVPISAERLKRCLGKNLWENLDSKVVLEAGCGSGRFTEILLQHGAYVQSIDLSSAVEANARNFPPSSSHRIALADIQALPFAPRTFDIVLCIGVVQHTPNPEQTIAALARHVKPGGALVIDHYTYTLSYFTKTVAPLRQILLRLSPERALAFTERIVNFFFPLHRLVKSHRWLQMLLSRISPVQTYFQTLPKMSIEDQKKFALVDTYDSLTDVYKHFRTKKQINRALERCGLTVEYCEKAGNGVEARALRT